MTESDERRAIGQILGRVVLWVFGAIGLVASVLLAVKFGLLMVPVGYGEARILEVIPAPDARQAAVIYFEDRQNASGKYLAVKIVQSPFPRTGDKIDPSGDVFRVVGTAQDWISRKPMRIQWWKPDASQGVSLDVCPAGAKIVRFDAGLYGDATTQVTLCETPEPLTASPPPQ